MIVDLSIIIVNWNTRDLLAQCLESIAGTHLLHNCAAGRAPAIGEQVTLEANRRALDTEIIVIDNASSDGSIAMVRSCFPSVRLIENGENVGFARANNQAIRLTQGRYVLLLNSDTVVHANAVENLVAFMEAQPQAGAAGARLLNADGTLQLSCHPMLTPEREFWRLMFLDNLQRRAAYPVDRWDARTPRHVEVIKGACLLLRRAALDQVGLLDESYFMYTEEVDLCYRLAVAGWELWYVPAAAVTHFGEASSQQVKEVMYVQLYRSKLQFYRKFGGEARARRAKALLIMAYAPRWLAATAGSPFSADLDSQARTFRRLLRSLTAM